LKAPLLLPVRVVRNDVAARDIACLELAAEVGAGLPAFTAGAHLDV
jgi:hypothetical protein